MIELKITSIDGYTFMTVTEVGSELKPHVRTDSRYGKRWDLQVIGSSIEQCFEIWKQYRKDAINELTKQYNEDEALIKLVIE